MPFTLRLTDGTDTIDFIDDAFRVEDGGLQITPPEQVQTWTDPNAIGTGARLVDSRYGNRKIKITFQISGANRTVIRQGISRINELLKTAIRHSLGLESKRVTLQYGWDGVDEVDHFEVFSGELELPDDVLSVEKLITTWGGDQYRLRECELELTVSPQAYGLSPSTGSLIELPLSNRNGTRVTGGLYVKAFHDPRNIQFFTLYMDNFVEISGSDIMGDSPAQLRIEIRTNGAALPIDRIWVGAQEKQSGTMAFHWTDPNVEIFLGGTSISAPYMMYGSAWRSNLMYKNWTGRVWRVRLQNPEAYGSKKYRVFMTTGFFPYFYANHLPMQLKVESGSGAVLAEGPIVEQYNSARATAMVQDLGVVQIPPYSPNIPDPQDVYLSMHIVGEGQFDSSTGLCYVWLVPVDSGYRYLRIPRSMEAYGIPENVTVVEDYWKNLSYLTYITPGDPTRTEHNSVAAVQAMFSPITLTPGKDHRIYFTFWGENYSPETEANWTIRVFYSPVYTGAV